MSTDREQHELAAKAAGLLLLWKTGYCKGGAFEAAFVGDQPWRPKDDDGDSLRLAVQLNLRLECMTTQTAASTFDRKISEPVDHTVDQGRTRWPFEQCPNAATRRAIFRAAVELGKAMQASTRPHNVARGEL
jgi:hypothetical protein